MNSKNGTIYNVLLFGETGAGKSTTINALANYIAFESFEDAIKGEFVQKIPSRIILPNPDDSDEDSVYQHGKPDENENLDQVGASVTQSPKDYLFELNDKQFRIIDTPGMGDTRGLNADKKNFKKILEHLQQFEQLHAICFLLKTNTTRKTAYFRYTLSKLLKTLHRSACANIMFCFTFSRNSVEYGPGDGYQTLKDFLKSNEFQGQILDLKTDKTCFYIDNESFWFLLANKYNYPFRRNRKAKFKESWNVSVRSTAKMLDRITELRPHDLRKTFFLIHARKWIRNMNEPINALIDQIELHHKEKRLLSQRFIERKQHFHTKIITPTIPVDAIEEVYENEIKIIENFIAKLAKFILNYSNIKCYKLIEPYLDIISDVENYNSEEAVSVDEILTLIEQLVSLEHSGGYFRVKFADYLKNNVCNPVKEIKDTNLDKIDSKIIESIKTVPIETDIDEIDTNGLVPNQTVIISNETVLFEVKQPNFINQKISIQTNANSLNNQSNFMKVNCNSKFDLSHYRMQQSSSMLEGNNVAISKGLEEKTKFRSDTVPSNESNNEDVNNQNELILEKIGLGKGVSLNKPQENDFKYSENRSTNVLSTIKSDEPKFKATTNLIFNQTHTDNSSKLKTFNRIGETENNSNPTQMTFKKSTQHLEHIKTARFQKHPPEPLSNSLASVNPKSKNLLSSAVKGIASNPKNFKLPKNEPRKILNKNDSNEPAPMTRITDLVTNHNFSAEKLNSKKLSAKSQKIKTDNHKDVDFQARKNNSKHSKGVKDQIYEPMANDGLDNGQSDNGNKGNSIGKIKKKKKWYTKPYYWTLEKLKPKKSKND